MSIFALHEKYYPIKDEQTLLSFLQENRDCLIKVCQEELAYLDLMKFRIKEEYTRKIKKEVSFLGYVKLNNMVYNDALMEEKTRDKRLNNLDRNYVKITDILSRLSGGETITMDEANKLLSRGFHQFFRNIMPFIMAFAGITCFIIMYKMNGWI